MPKHSSPLLLNIGFIIHEDVGYSRDFEFDYAELHLPPDLDLKDVAGMARFSRTPQGLLVVVNLSALTQADCVRCLDGIQQPIAIDFTELYAFNKRSVSESGLLVPDNGQIDLGPIAREYLLLDVPMNPLCKPDCLGLCPQCGNNLNQKKCSHKEDNIDPRFSKLQELLDKK